MAESGTYTPEVLARRAKMAESLLADPKVPVTHWAQGLNELLKGAVGGYQLNLVEGEEKAGRAEMNKALVELLGGNLGAGAPTPSGEPPLPAPTAGPRLSSPVEPPDQPSPYKLAGMAPLNSQDTFHTPLDAMSSRSQVADALRTATGSPPPMSGMTPAGATPVQTEPITPPRPISAPAGVAPPSGQTDNRAQIAAMLQNPNPYVQRLGQQLAQKYVQPETTGDIKAYEYARRQGYKGSLVDFMQTKHSKEGEFGITPIYGHDDKGNPVILQLGKGGQSIRTPVPEGVTLAGKAPIKMDTGTEFILLDPITRQVIGRQPKDIVGKESQEEVGKAKGLAQVDLPRVVQNAEQALTTIKQIREHPGKEYGVGGFGWVPGVPGTQQKDFVSLVDQAKGKAFLEAFNSLKGGGQITEVEGKKATDAIARLDRTQSKEGFETALKDLEEVITAGVGRARTKAGESAPAASAGKVRRFNPETGKIE